MFNHVLLDAFLFDANPKNWIKPFRKNTVWYLVLFAIFYHVISIGMMYMGSELVIKTIPDYQHPSFPVSIIMAATSGPIEETLFFGVPYYLSGNTHAMLAGGIIWSVAHIFSTQVFSLNALGYVSFLTTIPHLFFSLRVWSSGKGWFAILFHSAWNLAFLSSYCSLGLRDCMLFGKSQYMIIDVAALALTGSLLVMIFLLYSKNKLLQMHFKLGMIASVAIFVVSEIIINLKYLELFFS